jgi:sigma-B regulation protein RsbU (phosphoserine phosphatase)
MPSGSSPSFESSGPNNGPETPPVFALKELVARLQREQYKIQDLLSSLGFALRSLNNLNQFLELIPMIASRVTDAGGGALVLFRPDGQVRLERLHCQSEDQCQDVRSALEAATRQVTASFQAAPESSLITMSRNVMLSLDRQVNRYLGEDFQLFGTAIIVRNVERGRLYVFSRDPDYAWTETRQKLVRLVADQTSVAIENDELDRCPAQARAS